MPTVTLAVLETLRREAPDLYPYLSRAPMVMGRPAYAKFQEIARRPAHQLKTVPEGVVWERYRSLQIARLRDVVAEAWLVHVPAAPLYELGRLHRLGGE
ncbi:uncharacterized protein PG986_011615 [Apiospora aurea]|uniref:Uncharacterized protein n=1 Tax=Apiospora aurea TaxID=335848 RepID=A0ABR1PY85_9PEZI